MKGRNFEDSIFFVVELLRTSAENNDLGTFYGMILFHDIISSSPMRKWSVGSF